MHLQLMTSISPKKRKRVPIVKMEDKIHQLANVKVEDKIHQLANSIRRKFDRLPALSSNCCIYRVPRPLRNVNLDSYKPCLISIGPLHYGMKRLRGMQEQKLRYVQDFLRRNENKTLKDYLCAIRGWENKAREYYNENISLSSSEFTEMVLLDACFVIEFFLNWHWETLDENDRVFGKPSLEHVIRRDLLLIENQLPFFVLEGLYDLVFDDDDGESCAQSLSFIDLTCEVLVGEIETPEKLKKQELLHFVDFLRTYYLPSKRRDPNNTSLEKIDWDFCPSVGALHDAGVRFVVSKGESLLDIKFENGVLEIPRLEVEDHTECLLLNLSAFEQCHYHFNSYIVDYILFMDVLITTLQDVDILISSRIISNALGNNDDVARIFNTICRETTYEASKFYYSDVCRRLTSYSHAPWNRWRATLTHDYFSNPWTIISVVVAIVLLILTVVQTYCSVVSLKR